MTIRVQYHATERTDDLLFGIAIHDQNGRHLYGTNTDILGVDVPPADGDGEMSLRVPAHPAARRHVPRHARDPVDQTRARSTTGGNSSTHFEVMNPSRTSGLVAFPVDVKFGLPGVGLAEGTGA